jgi:hypothetical protein
VVPEISARLVGADADASRATVRERAVKQPEAYGELVRSTLHCTRTHFASLSPVCTPLPQSTLPPPRARRLHSKTKRTPRCAGLERCDVRENYRS